MAERVIIGPTIAGVKFSSNVKAYPDRDPHNIRVIQGTVSYE